MYLINEIGMKSDIQLYKFNIKSNLTNPNLKPNYDHPFIKRNSNKTKLTRQKIKCNKEWNDQSQDSTGINKNEKTKTI